MPEGPEGIGSGDGRHHPVEGECQGRDDCTAVAADDAAGNVCRQEFRVRVDILQQDGCVDDHVECGCPARLDLGDRNAHDVVMNAQARSHRIAGLEALELEGDALRDTVREIAGPAEPIALAGHEHRLPGTHRPVLGEDVRSIRIPG